jgi:hypothetical protein
MSSATNSPSSGDGRRVRRRGRATQAAATGAWAAGSLVLAIARLIRLIVGIVALIIVVAIVLRVLNANPGNSIVHDIHAAGRVLVGPAKTLFTIHNPKLAIAVNWGIAALVWLFVGGLIASLIARIGLAGARQRAVA